MSSSSIHQCIDIAVAEYNLSNSVEVFSVNITPSVNITTSVNRVVLEPKFTVVEIYIGKRIKIFASKVVVNFFKYEISVQAASALQTGFNANSRIWLESIPNPLRSRPHYRFTK